MASELPEQSIKYSALKPLNPNAKEFIGSPPRTWHHPQLGLIWTWSHGLFQIPPSMIPGPIHAYQFPYFGFFSLTMCRVDPAAVLPECSTEEHMVERMIANPQRPSQSRCMSQKRNRPTMNARRERGNMKVACNEVLRDEKISVGHPIIPFPTTVEDCNHSRTTTVMIKNVPYYFL